MQFERLNGNAVYVATLLLCWTALSSTVIAQNRNDSASRFRRVYAGESFYRSQRPRYSGQYSTRDKVWRNRLYEPRNSLYGFPGARPYSYYYRPWYVFPPSYWNYRPGAYRGLNPYYYRRFLYGYPPYPFDTGWIEFQADPFLY